MKNTYKALGLIILCLYLLSCILSDNSANVTDKKITKVTLLQISAGERDFVNYHEYNSVSKELTYIWSTPGRNGAGFNYRERKKSLTENENTKIIKEALQLLKKGKLNYEGTEKLPPLSICEIEANGGKKILSQYGFSDVGKNGTAFDKLSTVFFELGGVPKYGEPEYADFIESYNIAEPISADKLNEAEDALNSAIHFNSVIQDKLKDWWLYSTSNQLLPHQRKCPVEFLQSIGFCSSNEEIELRLILMIKFTFWHEDELRQSTKILDQIKSRKTAMSPNDDKKK